MKKYIRGIIMAVFAFVAILPQQVYAEDTGKVLLEKNEAQTAAVVKVQIPNAEQERISSLQLKLLVKDAAGNPAGEEILGRIESLAITFDDGISGKAKILEQIYHGDTGSLNIYISGTEPLFSGQDKNLLTVGCVSAVILGEEDMEIYLGTDVDSLQVVKGRSVVSILSEVEPVSFKVAGNPSDAQDPENPQDPEYPGGQLPAVDKSKLESVLLRAAEYAETEYTGESYGILKKAVEEGRAVYDRQDASQAEVDEAVRSIENAIGGLVPVTKSSAEPSQEELAKNPAGPAVQTGDVTRFGIYVVLLVLAMGTMTVGLERSLRRKPGNR